MNYGLDPVGNILSLGSTFNQIPAGSFTYNANDQTNGETYDANGNLMTSAGNTYSWDFEDRLRLFNNGAVTMLYDGDGNRVVKTVGTATTRYLVDELNPTGYPQVIEEVLSGSVQRVYTYGLRRLSQMQNINGTWTPSFYGYDGQGHVRFLTNSAGSATDTYDYDGYGNLIASTGSTPNVYRYRGEEWDSEVSLYNLRARWYNPATGRFLSRDPLDGGNKYAYAGSDPVNLSDPSGQGVLELISPFQAVLAAATVIAGSQVAVNIYNKNHGTSSYSFNPVGASFVCIMGASNYLLQKAGQAAVLTLVQVNGQSCKRDQRKTTAPPVPEPEPEPDPKPKPKPIPKPIGIGDEPPDCPNPLPIYIVPDVFPNIRRANWTAITIIDKPSILTRCSACEPQNRKDIRKRLTSLRNNNQVPTIDHVHEYPYASTAEGGSGAFLEVVPGSENSLEGNFLKIWLNAHGVWEGCQFQVLPILGAQ